jgi:hypothetical protein
MRAFPFRGQVGGGWALEIETFLCPVLWNDSEPSGKCHWGPQKVSPSYALAPSPYPPLPSESSTGDTQEDWEGETTCFDRRGEEGRGRSQIIRRRESLFICKSLNTLSCTLTLLARAWPGRWARGCVARPRGWSQRWTGPPRGHNRTRTLGRKTLNGKK